MKIKPRILVAESKASSARSLEEQFIPEGYEILMASSGQEVLKTAGKEDADIILLDEAISGMDSRQVIKQLKSAETTRTIPIILITSSEDAVHLEKAIKAGCEDFITRPVDKNELSSKVYTLLQTSRARPILDEKEKLESVLDNIEDGIIVLSRDLGLIHINSTAKNLLEIDPDGLPEDLLGYITSRFKIDHTGSLKDDLLLGPLTFDVERAETENTKALVLAATTSLVKNPLGELSGILIRLKDVTVERKEEFLKQTFLSLISHKLRTPISVITLNSSMLRDGAWGALNDEQKAAASGILEKSNILKALFDKLFGFAMLTGEKLNMTPEVMSLKERLPEIVDPVIKLAKDKKIDLDVRLLKSDVKVSMHPSHLNLIIGNLVENAIKFCDKEPAKITVSVEQANNVTSISVSDNGQGIPPEEKDKIFEKFYQVEKYSTGNVEGVGLGLALVKLLVDAYRGEISMDSEISKGSTFTVTLPGV